MNPYEPDEKKEIIENLITKDIWDERLLSRFLFGNLTRLLRPKEFFLLEERVNQTSTSELAEIRGVKEETIKRELRLIKKMISHNVRKDSVESKIHKYQERKRHVIKKSK